jgi:hypothetical protein
MDEASAGKSPECSAPQRQQRQCQACERMKNSISPRKEASGVDDG